MFLRSEKQVRHEKFISDSFRHFEKAVYLKKNFCQNNAECFEKNRDALIKSMNAWCEVVLRNNQEPNEVIFVFYFSEDYPADMRSHSVEFVLEIQKPVGSGFQMLQKCEWGFPNFFN